MEKVEYEKRLEEIKVNYLNKVTPNILYYDSKILVTAINEMKQYLLTNYAKNYDQKLQGFIDSRLASVVPSFLKEKPLTYGYQMGLKGDYTKIFLYGGKESSLEEAKDITSKTVFDTASFTKLLVITFLYDLQAKGEFDLNANIRKDTRRMFDLNCTWLQALNWDYNIQSLGSIKDLDPIQPLSRIIGEAFLKGSYILNDQFVYNDIIYMILSYRIENFEEKFHYFCEKNKMNTAKFQPNNYGLHATGGKANNLHVPSDPKTQVMGNATGAAGVYVNANDMFAFGKVLNDLKEEDLALLLKLRDPNNIFAEGNKKSLGGVYHPHPNGMAKTDTPPSGTKDSITSVGTSGVWFYYEKLLQTLGFYLFNPWSNLEGRRIDPRFGSNTNYLKILIGELCHCLRYMEEVERLENNNLRDIKVLKRIS